jgi:hypothetical protein
LFLPKPSRTITSRVINVDQNSAYPKAIEQFAGCQMQRPSQIVLLVLPWRHDLCLRTLWHPRRPDLGQQVNIKFIRKDHHLMGWQFS